MKRSRKQPSREPESLAQSGAALREAIRRAGLSYETVAHRLGLKGRSSIAQWCSGAIAVPLTYHSSLRQMLRAPQLFPHSALPTTPAVEHSLLLNVLGSYASMPSLPVELVERSSWEVWNRCVQQADWHSAGQYVRTLQEAIGVWRARLGTTTRRLERVRWAGAHGQLRCALYTCDWEQVERLSVALRQEIYRSSWLDVLDHSEQALILNTLSLADFFLKSRFSKGDAVPRTANRISHLRQALTAALNHIGEAERRLKLAQAPDRPPASPLRREVARLLLDATEASMIYEAREDATVAQTLVQLANRAASMREEARVLLEPGAGQGADTGTESEDPGRSGPEGGAEGGQDAADALGPEYREYLFEDIFPRIELECRYNAAVISALERGTSAAAKEFIGRSTAALQDLAARMPDRYYWRGELRMTELLSILQRVRGFDGAIPRDCGLEMRHVLGDLREDFNRNALMGLARSAASLEILLDTNLALLPDTSAPEREERIQSAAELVDWMDRTVESYPDVPTRLIVQWDRAALALLTGVRESSTVRDLIEVLQRLREYGGQRLPGEAARFLARIADGQFGDRPAAIIPASVRESLPEPDPSPAAGPDMILVLSPLLYPMMPISFIRPEGYSRPSPDFWSAATPPSPVTGP